MPHNVERPRDVVVQDTCHRYDSEGDSDTIVISSRSRILISPRKKGSRAMRDLLRGTSAKQLAEFLADDGSNQDRHVLRVQPMMQSTRMKTRTRAKKIKKKMTASDSHRDRTMAKQRRVETHTEDVLDGDLEGDSGERRNNEGKEEAEKVWDEDTEEEEEEEMKEKEKERWSQRAISDALGDESDTNSDTGRRLTRHSHGEVITAVAMQEGTSHRFKKPGIKTDGRLATGHHKEALRKQGGLSQLDTKSSDSEGERANDLSDGVGNSDSSGKSGGGASVGRLTWRSRETDRPVRKKAKSTTVSPSTQSARPHVSERRSRTPPPLSPVSSACDDSDLDESVILPPSATQEMLELKATLKKLASHDSSNMADGSRTANTSLASKLGTKVDKLSVPQFTSSANTDLHGRHRRPQAPRGRIASDGGDRSDDASSTRSMSSDASAKLAKRRFASPSSTMMMNRPVKRMSPPERTHLVALSSGSNTTTSTLRKSMPTAFKTSSRFENATFDPIGNNKSYGSDMKLAPGVGTPGMAYGSNAQGGRAVLSALKALQDKIRRLEEEREKLLQEVSDVKVKARKREAEFASSEKRFTYELGQTKESARAAYDSLRSEKEELKLELVRQGERRKAIEAELEHVHKLASTYSGKADDLQTQLETTETQLHNERAKINSMEVTHKHEQQDLRDQITNLTESKDAAEQRIQELEAQFERESSNHAESREHLREAEQTITAISQLNENLVNKVWEANELANQATKKSKKLQQQQRVSTLSRPTAASRAASVNGSGTGNASTARREPLKKGTRKGVTAQTSEKGKRSSIQGNNLELLKAANLGRDVPFVLGGTSANRSFSLIGSVQEAIRQCDSMYACPETNPPRGTKAKIRKSPSTVASHETARKQHSTSAAILGVSSNATTQRSSPNVAAATTLIGAARTRKKIKSGTPSKAVSSSATDSHRPPPIRVPTATASYTTPLQSQIMDDLDQAVEAIEHEFEMLESRYRVTASRVKEGGVGVAQLSTTLGPMMDELEAKKKQLDLLKQVRDQAARSTINPNRYIVHSPEAVRRKTASLRILNDYRHLEAEAKSPRGTRSIRSPRNGAHCRQGSLSNDRCGVGADSSAG